MQTLFRRIEWVFKRPYNSFLIILMTLLSVCSLFLLPRLQFEFEMNDFFPSNTKSVSEYDAFTEELGSVQYNVLLAVQPSNQRWDYEFLTHFKELNSRLTDSLELYRSFTVLDIAGTAQDSSIGLMSRNTAEQRFVNKRENWINDPRFSSFMFTKNGEYTMLFLQQIDEMSTAQAMAAIDVIKRVSSDFDELNTRVLSTGYLHQQIEELQKKEIIFFALLAIIVCMIVSFMVFRFSWRFVLVAMGSLAVMFACFGGLLALFQVKLNLLMALLPIIILIVGTADIVHFCTKFQTEIETNTLADAMRIALHDIGFATFLTSVTTALAFSVLSINSIFAIRMFGLSAALAVLMAYIVLIFFTIPLLSVLYTGEVQKRKPRTTKLFARIYDFSLQKEKLVLWLTAIFTVGAIATLPFLSFNFQPMDLLPDRQDVSKEFLFFEEQLNGIRPTEIFVKSKAKNMITDLAVLQSIAEVEEYLTDSLEYGSTLSPTFPYKFLNSFQRGDKAEFYTFPTTERRFTALKKLISRNTSAQHITRFQFNEDSTMTRIITSMPTLSSKEMNETGTKLKNWLASHQDENASFHLSGFAELMYENVDYIRANMLRGLLLSLLFVSVLIALVFKKRMLFWAAILPNVLPLLFAAAAISLLQVNFDSTMTMIFAILFGLVVDDTIHFLSKYSLERKNGNSVEASIKTTLHESGKAIVLTSILVFSGLFISLFSVFSATRLVGLLMGVTIVFALLCDLFLLPIVLRKFEDQRAANIEAK